MTVWCSSSCGKARLPQARGLVKIHSDGSSRGGSVSRKTLYPTHAGGSSGGETNQHKPGSHTATGETEIAQLHLITASAAVKRSYFFVYAQVLE